MPSLSLTVEWYKKQPVWPDDGIKSRPFFSKNGPKNTQSCFSFNLDFFKIDQQAWIYPFGILSQEKSVTKTVRK